MLNKYLLIDGYVHGANVNNSYCVGVPTLPSIWGWLHSMELKLSSAEPDNELMFCGFTVSLNNLSFLNRTSLKQTEKGKVEINHPIIERHKANFGITLVIELEQNNQETNQEITDKVSSVLTGSRLSGGLLDLKAVTVFEKNSDGLTKAFESHPQNAFVLEDMSPFLKGMTGDERLEQIYQSTFLKHYKGSGDFNWFTPVINGYHFITKPKERTWARNNKLHCFAEPSLSYCKAIPVASAIKNLIRTNNEETLFFIENATDNSFSISNIKDFS
ncbi:hypothetical protein VCHA53O466_40032 [Vibrio chagasii]|nr:hypothetical protein VCHA53O466_40032 [Vibrio chagasii]